ncbi:HNH endonuclease [Pseudomonas poae]|uniref:HNH endonuclease n=1 Tax=Pseudomonas poae TaxID=200451 RepID=A0A2S9ETG0_9PSED|nr:hypothetical protein [Pseudomonas poae]PRA27986.1 hypothetical protein CQZ97_16865 [Pseudomonas poae]PRC19090.1 hypothetical protein CQZ99_12335 [Pseudomonas poae]
MSQFKTLTTVEVRTLRKHYSTHCFGNTAYLTEVQDYIQSMAQQALTEYVSRRSGGGITNTTLWQDFYTYVSPTNPKVTGVAIREHIRAILEKEQHYQCCYCRRPLLNDAHAKPIEHVLPHSIFVQHTFDILNLSIACVDCNRRKTDNIWTLKAGKFMRTRHYPAASAFTDMYHPRIHRYDDHVTFFRVQSNTHCISIYTGLTAQGKNLCKNLLTHISKLELFVSANSELKHHMAMINEQDFRPGSDAEIAIKAFKRAFQDATDIILEHV